jgi:hypothetical protein
MIRQIIWKEWHEHRAKYIGYWLTIYAPLILLALGIACTEFARRPFADLNDAQVLKYLPLSLTEAAFTLTIFMLFTAYLAVATFSPEIDDRSIFFLYEQGLPRQRYLAIKLLNGGAHIVLATFSAVLVFPMVCYLIMLMSGKLSTAGSGAAFSIVLSTAARAGVWCALISLAVFTASAVIAAVIPRWWLASLCSVVGAILFVGWGLDAFRFLPDMPENSMSIGFGFGTGTDAKWVTISRALTPAELNAIALWWPGPLVAALLLTAGFCMLTAWLYKRHELV